MGDREPVCVSARRELEKLRFPRRVSLNQQYIRSSDLNDFLDKQAIKQILDCRCYRCKEHLSNLNKAHLIDPRRAARLSLEYVDRVYDAKALFALLISIEHPMFIIPFVDNENASSIQHYCSLTTQLGDLESVWSEYRTRFPDDSNELAAKFIDSVHMFAPPVIRDENFTIYHENTRLPFHNQKWLGEGSYGTVYSFEICEEYIDRRKVPAAQQTLKFARKQLKNESGKTDLEFELEKNNLGLVKVLEDQHIVQIVKSYRKGKEFNILFPCAKANLRECFENPELGLAKLCAGPLRGQEIWQQMLGLAKALDRILNLDLPEQLRRELYNNPNHQILGYHFDLKPANILVFDNERGKNNVLKISDFGQAKFKTPTGDSRTTIAPGTEDYAAPESSSLSLAKSNSRYDVWSLGCIFAELSTFALKGHTGVRDFEKNRKSTTSRWLNHRYFDEQDVPGGQRRRTLRKAVKDWIESLLEPPGDSTEIDKQFLLEIKSLLFKMLEVNVKDRYTSTQVYQSLEKTLDKSQDAPLNGFFVSGKDHRPEIAIDIEEVGAGVGNRKAGHLSTFFARHNRMHKLGFLPACIQVAETDGRLELRTTTSHGSVTEKEPYNNLQIVPKYAFRTGYHTTMADWDFRFVSIQGFACSTGLFDYKCRDYDDVRTLQGILTGHDVRRSFELAKIHFEPRVSPLRVFKGLKARVKKTKAKQNSEETDQDSTSTENTSITLQIWKQHQEQPYTEPIKETAGSNTVRVPRRAQPLAQAAACRLVIFEAPSIFTLRVANEMRMNKEIVDPKRHVVRFEPVRPHSQSFILASTLSPPPEKTHRLEFPGIPLANEDLLKAEECGRVELKYFDIEFHRAKDMDIFRVEYQNLKAAWDDEEIKLGIKRRPT